MARLFADENQTNPDAMLKDLVALYVLHYGVDVKKACLMIRSDTWEINRQNEIEKIKAQMAPPVRR